MYIVVLPTRQTATYNTLAILNGKWTGLSSTGLPTLWHFHAPKLTIDVLKVFLIHCELKMMFLKFQLKEMELGNLSPFLAEHFIIMQQRNHINLPAR